MLDRLPAAVLAEAFQLFLDTRALLSLRRVSHGVAAISREVELPMRFFQSSAAYRSYHLGVLQVFYPGVVSSDRTWVRIHDAEAVVVRRARLRYIWKEERCCVQFQWRNRQYMVYSDMRM